MKNEPTKTGITTEIEIMEIETEIEITLMIETITETIEIQTDGIKMEILETIIGMASEITLGIITEITAEIVSGTTTETIISIGTITGITISTAITIDPGTMTEATGAVTETTISTEAAIEGVSTIDVEIEEVTITTTVTTTAEITLIGITIETTIGITIKKANPCGMLIKRTKVAVMTIRLFLVWEILKHHLSRKKSTIE